MAKPENPKHSRRAEAFSKRIGLNDFDTARSLDVVEALERIAIALEQIAEHLQEGKK